MVFASLPDATARSPDASDNRSVRTALSSSVSPGSKALAEQLDSAGAIPFQATELTFAHGESPLDSPRALAPEPERKHVERDLIANRDSPWAPVEPMLARHMMLKRRQRLGQYRIEGRISIGGFAEVYRAYDTVEGIRVALKLPHENLVDATTLANFRREVRVVAKLDHPNILPIKTAGMMDERFVIVTPLGIESLADRLERRIARRTALSFMEQMLDALACAHKSKIAHLDVKPENLILFPDNRLRLADFGLARVAFRTMSASGSGTVGYLAPEQALGKPSMRSDVFSAALIMWRLMSGALPDWPFKWPYVNAARASKGYHPALIRLVRRALSVDERKRFPTAVAMRVAFNKVKTKALL